jgi:hypothetical protein
LLLAGDEPLDSGKGCFRGLPRLRGGSVGGDVEGLTFGGRPRLRGGPGLGSGNGCFLGLPGPRLTGGVSFDFTEVVDFTEGGLPGPRLTGGEISVLMEGGLPGPRLTGGETSVLMEGGLPGPRLTGGQTLVLIDGGLPGPRLTGAEPSDLTEGGLPGPRLTGAEPSALTGGVFFGGTDFRSDDRVAFPGDLLDPLVATFGVAALFSASLQAGQNQLFDGTVLSGGSRLYA